MKRILIILTLLFFCAAQLNAQNTKKNLEIDDILKMKTVGEVQISPDGKWVAYTVSENDMKKDKSLKRIYMMPMAGGEAIAISS